MKRVEGLESTGNIEYRRGPEFIFTNPNTLLFLTGAPLSGKSTIAPIIASSIEGCAQQSMDIVRLMAQEVEAHKSENERNPFVQYGSCDSYTLIGDGSYSPESLVDGFNEYSSAVTSLLTRIIPKLETQGVRNVLFEGVQLTPHILAPYLVDSNRLIIVTSSEEKLLSNRGKLFAEDHKLLDRYSIDRLLLLQDEILRQSRDIPSDKILCVDNTQDYRTTVSSIISSLLSGGVIQA